MKIDPFPGVLARDRYRRAVLTDAQREWFRRWFPEEENGLLMKASGMTLHIIKRVANELGLKKSSDGLRRIYKRRAERAKRTNEKSGYYDTIRGRRPSEATLEGIRRWWQRTREQPSKYRALKERRSEDRKSIVRKERAQLHFGLERKTEIRIMLHPYTQRQRHQRYYASCHGYILMDDCSEGSGYRYVIFYDDNTRRGKRFEENLRRDGFTVRRWEE